MSNRSGLRPLDVAVRTTLGLASLAIGSAAFAQQAQQDQEAVQGEVEEIVVTGFRESLSQALDVKREQIGAVDAIVAEDIADFPDLNLAESLQRIPGVSIARDAGEGRQITVRGLSPEFTRVRLNGMEAMSANGGTDAAGGTNRGRSFDFNTFASELFNSITVRKTSSAEVEEGSLGATVDLRTGRPFDYDGLTIVTSANAQYNDLSEDIDPRAAFVISDTFADGKFGALLSVAYTERHLTDEGASSVRWTQHIPTGNPQTTTEFSLAPGYAGAPTIAQINNAFTPRIPRYDAYEHNQERLGVTSSLQFAPTDSTAINLDLLYAKFDAERSEIFLEVPNFSNGTTSKAMQVADAAIDGANSLVYGVFNNVDLRTESRFDELSTEFTQATLDFSQGITDTVKINGLIGKSKAENENPTQTTLIFDWNNVPYFSYDYRGNNRMPTLNYGNTPLTSTTNGTPRNDSGPGGTVINTTDSGGWYLSQVRLRPNETTNEFTNGQLDADWEFSDMLSFKGGVQYKKFEFTTLERRIDPSFCTPAGNPTSNAESCAASRFQSTPLASYGQVYTYSGDINGSNASFLIPNINAANGLFNLNSIPLSATPILGNNRGVEEEDTGAFAQVQLITDVFGMPLRGNLGVRYVQTDQFSRGFAAQGTGATVVPVTAQRDYSDTLPSLNVSLNVTDAFIVRAAAAKVMSRPPLDALTPGFAVSVSGQSRTVSVGNPNIDPTRAKAYDLGFEWYFARESLLSLALFYKDIDSRAVSNTLSNQVFTGNPFGIPDSFATAACGTIAGCSAAAPIWQFTQTVNGPGGDLKGFEIGYQQPFTFLPGFLSNFGTQLNYTGVDSKITYVGGIRDDLTGLSRSAFNATLYYETDKFGARVSAAYRDEYLTRVPGRENNDVEGTKEVTTIDMSARYTVIENLDLTLEGINLTDEYEDQYLDSVGNRLSYYHHTGRSYLVGARYKF
jgi:iron complex outermembrane receptor protein